jgi:ADP-heptose:LPS heptosyltransferase
MNKTKKIIHNGILAVFSFLNFLKIGGVFPGINNRSSNINILYICLAERGDIIITSAALKRLKVNFSECHIDYICKKEYIGVAKLLPQVSGFFSVSLSFSIINLFYLVGLIFKIRKFKYDVIFDESGVHASTVLWFFSRARSVFSVDQYGFGKFSSGAIDYSESYNILERRENLTNFICSDGYLFKPDIIPLAKQFKRVIHLPENYISLQPIAGWRGKNIEPDVAYAIVSFINTKFALPVVVLGGIGDFEKIFDRNVDLNLINLTGSLSVEESSAVVNYAKMHVGADSFLRHVATGLDTPSITIYGSTNHKLSGYHDKKHVSLFSDHDCRPIRTQYCHLKAGRTCPHLSCMKNIPMSTVWDVIDKHMEYIQ